MEYQPVIGLEIHTELKTKIKMFCYSPNDPREQHPNVNVCPICMGHPGTLPIINKEAVKKTILAGLALKGEIAEFSQFDRKNYFYPDLPKGYQISQYKHPLVTGGHLNITVLTEDEGQKIKNQKSKIKSTTQNSKVDKRIRIRRIHLEEDTGRLIHDKGSNASLVDFNRAGVPLMELVTEPDFSSGEEVKKFGEEFQQILRYVGASDANMERGQLRVEVNISLLSREEFAVSPTQARLARGGNFQFSNDKELGTKVEIKNINSFKFAADAIDYEIRRQTKLLERGEKVIQETRGWNENQKITFSQRSKEEAHDYRYFPEPDLPPLKITKEFIEKIRAKLPELPQEKQTRFQQEYGLDETATETLTKDKNLADYFEEVVSEAERWEKDLTLQEDKNLPQAVSSFITTELLRLIHEKTIPINEMPILPENLAELIVYIFQDKISRLASKEVLNEMFESREDPSQIIDKMGLWQISDNNDLQDVARHVIKENPAAVEDYKNGKTAALQFLVGQIMKESRGKANPKIIQKILEDSLRQHE